MCKLFVAVFLEKNSDEEVQAKYDAQKKYMSPVSAWALCISATLFPIMGVLPHLTMDKLADLSQGFMGLPYGKEACRRTTSFVCGIHPC